MINPNDYVLIYRNGHLKSIGIGGILRGFKQDKINIICGYPDGPDCTDVDREKGTNEYYEFKPVDMETYNAAAEKLHQEHLLEDQNLKRLELIAEQEMQLLGEKAETWYNTLPDHEKKMIDVLVIKWMPIAVA